MTKLPDLSPTATDGQEDMILVGQAGGGREAVESFHRLRPDVTLMDLRMPDMSGIEAISAIRTEFPNARIIVLTTYAGDAQAAAALKAGAAGYLLKNLVRKELIETIWPFMPASAEYGLKSPPRLPNTLLTMH